MSDDEKTAEVLQTLDRLNRNPSRRAWAATAQGNSRSVVCNALEAQAEWARTHLTRQDERTLWMAAHAVQTLRGQNLRRLFVLIADNVSLEWADVPLSVLRQETAWDETAQRARAVLQQLGAAQAHDDAIIRARRALILRQAQRLWPPDAS